MLNIESAVMGPGPTSSTKAELITAPPGPVVPSTLAVSGPVPRMTAGPPPRNVDGAVSVKLPPPGGKVTNGVGSKLNAAPKMVTFPLFPKALAPCGPVAPALTGPDHPTTAAAATIDMTTRREARPGVRPTCVVPTMMIPP